MKHKSLWIAGFLPILLVFVFTTPAFTSGLVNGTVRPALGERALTGVYIPKNLEESFVELRKVLPKRTLEEMKSENMPMLLKVDREDGNLLLHRLGQAGQR